MGMRGVSVEDLAFLALPPPVGHASAFGPPARGDMHRLTGRFTHAEGEKQSADEI